MNEYIKKLSFSNGKYREYEIFTDIEFNPKKSFSCQAKSVALFLGLQKAGILEQVTKDADSFLEFYKTQTKKDELF